MNRKYVLGAAAVATAAVVASLVGADLASAAPDSRTATAAAGPNLGTSQYLPLAAARKAADTAIAACKAKGYPVSVTVVDRDGVVIVQERADTATGATVAVSMAKAYASAGFQTPTDVLQKLAPSQPGLADIPGFVILPGGLPIAGGGSVIAGIGVAGAPSGAIDASCATAGIAALS